MPPIDSYYDKITAESPSPGLDRRPQQKFSSALLWIALALCLLLGWILVLFLRPTLDYLRNASPIPNTPNSMKQLGMVFKMYARESRGNYWPPLGANGRIWAPDLSVLYPEYLTDPSVLVAREHPEAKHIQASLRAVLDGPNPDYDTAEGLMALSFAYIGYAVKDEVGFAELVEARSRDALDVSGKALSTTDGLTIAFPLRTGVERFFITDINGPGIPPGIAAAIPVLVETWRWKAKDDANVFPGANVLFFDGHVKEVPLGTFPVVPSVMDALCGLSP